MKTARIYKTTIGVYWVLDDLTSMKVLPYFFDTYSDAFEAAERAGWEVVS